MTVDRHERELAAAVAAYGVGQVALDSTTEALVVRGEHVITSAVANMLSAMGLDVTTGDGTLALPTGDAWRAARVLELAHPDNAELRKAVAAGQLEPVADLPKYRSILESIKPNEWADLSEDARRQVLEQREQARATPGAWVGALAATDLAGLGSALLAVRPTSPGAS